MSANAGNPEDGSEVALDDLEDDYIDEDAVPTQKVEVNNVVCVHPLIERHTKLMAFHHRLLFVA
jgi:hypothetical protein